MQWLSEEPQRVGNRHIQIFIPSVDRDGNPVPEGQQTWVEQCLEVMGTHFGGATALPPARGVWRDDERDGRLVYDDPVVIFSYVSEDSLTGPAGEALLEFIHNLGREANQGEVGLFVDGTYYGFQDFTTELAESKGGSDHEQKAP